MSKKVVALVFCVTLLFGGSSFAGVYSLSDALGLTGTANVTNSLGVIIDEGVVYLKATLEVTSDTLSVESSYGGIGVDFFTDPFEFGQPWTQSQWGTGGTTTPPEPYNMPLFPNLTGDAIVAGEAVTVVLKYDYNAVGQDGGSYLGVYFAPTLTLDEADNSSTFTSDGRDMSDSMANVYYRVGADTENVWSFTDVSVYSAGDTPFAVPEPASVAMLGIASGIGLLIRRRFAV